MTAFNDWLIVVPSRLNSQRLPNKPLQRLGGKPLVQRVYENLKPLALEGATIVVAIDAESVRTVCADLGIPWVMTKEDHPSGTDRCHEVAQQFHQSYIMNVQGDEPFIQLNDLKNLARSLEQSKAPMATMGLKVQNHDHFVDPNVVKIVRGYNGNALYFSRATVPFDREAARSGKQNPIFWQHLGVYAFTRQALHSFCALPPSPLEQIEKLEQLRAVEAGWRIHVSEATTASLGIDTPEDLHRAEELLAQL